MEKLAEDILWLDYKNIWSGGRGQQDLVDDGLISLLVKQKGKDRSQGLQLPSLNFFARK